MDLEMLVVIGLAVFSAAILKLCEIVTGDPLIPELVKGGF